MRSPHHRCVCWLGNILVFLVLMPAALAQQPITFQYIYDELGQLIKVVDSTGTVIEYVYDKVGNILEVKRSTVTGLAVFHFRPSQGPVGTKVSIQGQGFSTVLTENTVTFNGTVVPVTAATNIRLEVIVPSGAITGPITVTVAGEMATSDRDFTVLAAPTITSVAPTLALAGAVIPNVQVQGSNLTGATFTLIPAFVPPALTVTSATSDPTGTSATLNVTVASTTVGSFVVVATNTFGRSSIFSSTANTVRILNGAADDDGDGLSNSNELIRGTDPFNGDTDGDGFGDGDEVNAGSNPLDRNSLPVNLHQSPGEVEARPFAVLNTVDPSQPPPGQPPDPALFVGEIESRPFAILNTIDPSQPPPGQPPDPTLFVGETEGEPFSILNILEPTDPSLPGEAVSPIFSVENLYGL